MRNKDKIIAKFNEYELDLSYEQKQKVKDGQISIVIQEQLEMARRMIRFQKGSIYIGILLLAFIFYLIFYEENTYSVLLAICSGVGTASFFGGIYWLKYFNSYKKNIRSLNQTLQNKQELA